MTSWKWGVWILKRRRSSKPLYACTTPARHIAAVLLALLSLANVLSPLVLPDGVVVVVAVLGVAGLIGAAGLWMLKRWSVWLTIIVCVLNILLAAPGLVFAPNPTLRTLAAVGVVGFALVILLAVLPSARRAYTYRASPP
jgi:uncharacterized membrane protein (DUF2068 family)